MSNPNLTHDQIFDNILEIIKKLLPGVETDNVARDAGLNELGLNSLTFVELVVSIEQKYGFEFEDDMLSLEMLNNLDSLVNYISSKAI